MKNIRIAAKISMITIGILAVGLVGLWFVANRQMTRVMKTSILQHLDNSVATQAEIVRSYVDKAETYLIGYAQDPEMVETFLDPGNTAKTDRLQEYTDRYADTGDNLENIYAADSNSTVIASRVQGVIGVTLREGEALKQLQDALTEGMYNTGIMASKATGAQVISMYYPVNDNNGQLAGYVGAAIFAENLRDTLNELSGKEEGNSYMLLDAAAGTYIFCPDDELTGMSIEDKDVLTMLEIARSTKEKEKAFEYVDAVSDKKMISAIYYLEERDWVLVALSDWETAFAPVRSLTSMLAIVCLIVLIVISLAIWLCVSMISHDISGEAGVIQEIGTLDFTEKDKLKNYCGRKDEVGMIADATRGLVDAVYLVVTELQNKSSELQKTAGEMNSSSAFTFETVKTLESAIQEISIGAGNQASETENASESVVHIGNQIAETKEMSMTLYKVAEKINSSSDVAIKTLQMLADTNEQAKAAVEKINEQTLTTNESVLKIKDAAQLITSIAEETNLLSLNASIEAARAGEQGSGFAVVAGQIKKLAEQSNSSAQYIDSVIDMLLQESSQAVQIMDDVREIMRTQNEHLADTEECFREVTQNVEVTQKEIINITKTISGMDEERNGVIDVVQNLTAIAEENAAGTQESLASTEMVNEMVKKVADAANELTELADAIEKNIIIFRV
ncbi:MAG: methyl-accepting chemotaxis protein [Roseburia sp.]|nr:methyl-accepting chemotaxis protein [Roseburia sp.]MCM1241368.1 methyl-accepting chemotaxis protein [Roseburia sp.]